MRRMWAKWRRLNRASRSASERLRLCGPELSVLPFTTSPPGKKLRGATSHPNPEPPLSGRCSPRTLAGEKGEHRCGNAAVVSLHGTASWKSRECCRKLGWLGTAAAEIEQA